MNRRLDRLITQAWRRRRREWPLLGLLAILAVFGHDALMTGDVHVRQAVGSSHVSRQLSPAHGSLDSRESDGAATDVTHGEDCAVVRPVVAPNDGASGSLGDGLGLVSPDRPLAPPGWLGWSEPTWSAGLRRSLFQVYRI